MGNFVDFYKVEVTDCNNTHYYSEEFDKLFLEATEDNEDSSKDIYKMNELTILNDNKEIHYENLKLFTTLKKLCISDPTLISFNVEIT